MSTLSTARRVLHAATPALALSTAALTAVLAACADAPTSPSAARSAAPSAAQQTFVAGPHADRAGATTPADVVAPAAPAGADSVMTIVVPPSGATLTAPGVAIAFPAGFVARPTTFTVTRKAGAVVGYDFQPSGTFRTPVTITLDLHTLKIPPGRAASMLQGAYVRHWAQVDPATGHAAVNEFVPTTVDKAAKTATLTLSHFSGYLVSWNRH